MGALVAEPHDKMFSKKIFLLGCALLPVAFDGSLPHQCLTSCVYTKTGMSSPKSCFARGDLATECRDPVTVQVVVQSATTGHAVANASVNLFNFLSGLSDTSYTNGEGIASFSVSRDFVGVTASISCPGRATSWRLLRGRSQTRLSKFSEGSSSRQRSTRESSDLSLAGRQHRILTSMSNRLTKP